MSKYKVVLYVILAIASVALIAFFSYFSYGIYDFFTAPVRTTKDCMIIYVEEGDVLDGEAIVSPPEKYSQLLKIDVETRKELAKYMEKKNYKLESGEHEVIYVEPTLEELQRDFRFESID